ncbi:MAG: PGF-pre-PGF domain-containing protein [Nanobdellota archaeon]
MKAKLLMLCLFLVILMQIAVAEDYTVCSDGCNFKSLESALGNINDTANNSVIINEKGEYTLPQDSTYSLNTNGSLIDINSSNVSIDCGNSELIGNTYGKAIRAKLKQNITIKNCKIKQYYIGVNFVSTNLSKIKNCEFSDFNSSGVLLDTVNESIVIDSSIKNSSQGIITSSSGTSKIVNTSFASSGLDVRDSSAAIVQWTNRVHVRDSFGNNMSSATVNITNITGDLVYNLTTDNAGLTDWKNITAYKEFGNTTKKANPYLIKAFNNNSHNTAINFTIDSSTTINLTYDLTPPEIISGPYKLLANSSANINFTTDFNSNATLSYNATSGASVIKQTDFKKNHIFNLENLSSETDYSYTIRLCKLGNYCNRTKDYTFTTEKTPDTIPPAISFSKPHSSGGTIYNDWYKREIRISTNEPSSCSIDSSIHELDFSNQKNLVSANNHKYHSIKFNASSDGNYDVKIECEDYADEPNSNSKEVSFYVNDTTPPQVEFTSKTIGEDDKTNDEDLVFYVSLDQFLITPPQISLDSKSNNSMIPQQTNYIYNKTFSGLSEGEHNITVYASDEKGNTVSVKRTFYNDFTAPDMDVEQPEDEKNFRQCNAVKFNLTMNELGNCEYDLLYIDEERLEDCENDCDDRYDRCMNRADDNDEEDECKDERDECKDTCEDEKYREEDENEEIEVLEDIGDCKDNCEDDYDNCEDKCEEELDVCEEEYGADDICDEDYRDCREDCDYDEEKCKEDCEEMEFTFFKNITKHLKNAEYLAKFYCEDKAGNEVVDNVTFNMDDTTPPSIIYKRPNRTVEKDSTYLVVKTDEKAKCKYSDEEQDFNEMSHSFGVFDEFHSVRVEDLAKGDYSFYVLCNDTKGNLMSTPENIEFLVNISKESENDTTKPTQDQDDKDSSSNLFEKELEAINAMETKKIIVTQENMALREISITPNANAEKVNVKVEQFNQQDLVDNPEGILHKYFTISKSGLNDQEIGNAEIRFRVDKEWVTKNNLDPDKIHLNEYLDKWEKRKPMKSSEDQSYYYYQTNISKLSMFAITADQPKENTADKTPAKEKKDNNTSDDNTEKQKEPNQENPGQTEEKGKLWLWILLLCVVVGGGLAVFFVVRPHARHPQQDQAAKPEQQAQTQAAAEESAAAASPEEDSQNKEIDISQVSPDDEMGQYIVNARQYGQSIDEIKNNLVQAGHDPMDVHEKLISLNIIKDEVKEYIEGSISQNMGEDKIIESLEQNGFQREYIDKKLSEIKGDTAARDNESSGESYNSNDYEVELKDYIEKAKSSGMDKEAIKQNLINAGHKQDIIDNALNKYMPENKDPNKELKDYIQKCFDSNLSKFHIKKILKDAGYKKAEVKKAFKEVGK